MVIYKSVSENLYIAFEQKNSRSFMLTDLGIHFFLVSALSKAIFFGLLPPFIKRRIERDDYV